MLRKITIICLLIIIILSLTNILGAAESKVLKLAHLSTTKSMVHLGFVRFKELVEEKTEGQVIIEIYPGGVLSAGGLTAMQTGDVDIGPIISSDLMDFNPRWGIFEMPFLFFDLEAADKVLEGELIKELYGEVMGANVVLLNGRFEDGYRHMTNNIRPIHTVDDLKGMKTRVMATPLQTAIFTALGASPVPIPYDELYGALHTGIVDAQENPFQSIVDKSLFEVQKYLSLTGHSYYGMPVGINVDAYNSLSPEIQKILNDSFHEACLYQRRVSREENEKARKTLEEKGMIINDLTFEGKMTFVKASQSVWDKFADEIGKDFINQFMKEMGREPLY